MASPNFFAEKFGDDFLIFTWKPYISAQQKHIEQLLKCVTNYYKPLYFIAFIAPFNCVILKTHKICKKKHFTRERKVIK